MSLRDLSNVVHRLYPSAPGPDCIISAMIKLLFENSPNDLLAIVNHSMRTTWILTVWCLSKVTPMLKNKANYLFSQNKTDFFNLKSAEFSWTSVVWTSHTFHYKKTNCWTLAKLALSRRCSIWCAHTDLESRVRLARRCNPHAAIVTLDISKDYDNVVHGSRFSGYGP